MYNLDSSDDYYLNIYEEIVFLLGRAGMTTEISKLFSDIQDILARKYGSKALAKGNFNNAVNRSEFISKVDRGVYCFTQDGWDLYCKLDRHISSIENSGLQLQEFLDVFMGPAIDHMTDGHLPYLEVPLNAISKGLGPDYVEQLYDFPEKTISNLNKALSNHDQVLTHEYDPPPVIEIIDCNTVLNIEEARQAVNLGKFIEVTGRVSLQTQTKPTAKIAAFECLLCNHVQYIPQPFGGRMVEPLYCENSTCDRKGPFKMLDKPETTFVDSQLITLESPVGQVQLQVALQGHQCQPPWVRDGKIMRITGVLKHLAQYQKNGKRSDFEYLLLANSVRFADDSIATPPTEEDIQVFREWANDPVDLRNRILNSIAPHIHGHEVIKDAASLSIFSDWTWDQDPKEVVVRSSIHILLIGDPGVAKTQVMRDVLHMAPKSKFAQIVGSTKGGLANSALQLNGEWVIKAGIFSHADQGLLGLDEIDKFPNKEDLNCLIGVLEDQIQIVSKVGMSEIPFNGRTAVLSTANPRLGNLNRYDPIIDQLDLPLYIMQRYDLIFVIFDTPDKETDTSIANSIANQHHNPSDGRKTIERDIDVDLFRKYVLYARSLPIPTISAQADAQLSQFYLMIRGKYSVENKDPLISARSLNNLYRVARAIARREMSPEVTEDHAKYAIYLVRQSMRSMSLGEEDSSVFEFGSTKSQRSRIQNIRDAIQHLCRDRESALIADIAMIKGLDPVEVEHTLQMLKRRGEVMRLGAGYRLVQ